MKLKAESNSTFDVSMQGQKPKEFVGVFGPD
jgi:hypothetical protein